MNYGPGMGSPGRDIGSWNGHWSRNSQVVKVLQQPPFVPAYCAWWRCYYVNVLFLSHLCYLCRECHCWLSGIALSDLHVVEGDLWTCSCYCMPFSATTLSWLVPHRCIAYLLALVFLPRDDWSTVLLWRISTDLDGLLMMTGCLNFINACGMEIFTAWEGSLKHKQEHQESHIY